MRVSWETAMHNRFWLGIWAVLAVAPVSTVTAGGPAFHFESLRYPLVQKELGPSRRQVIEINLRLKSYDDAISRALREGSLPDLKNVTEQERIRLMQASNKEGSLRNWKVMQQFADRFDNLLDARQRLRLYEIDWQVGWKTTGGRALADSELAELIGLSREQRTQVQVINDAFKDKEDHLIYSDGAGGLAGAAQGSCRDGKALPGVGQGHGTRLDPATEGQTRSRPGKADRHATTVERNEAKAGHHSISRLVS